MIKQLQYNIRLAFNGNFKHFYRIFFTYLIKVIDLRVNLDSFSLNRDVIRIIFIYNDGYKSITNFILSRKGLEPGAPNENNFSNKTTFLGIKQPIFRGEISKLFFFIEITEN